MEQVRPQWPRATRAGGLSYPRRASAPRLAPGPLAVFTVSLLLASLAGPACTVDVDLFKEGFPCNPDGSCEHDLVCLEGICVTDPCAGAECGPEALCVHGHCYPRDCSDRACPEGLICIEGHCVTPDCATVECEQGEACAGGRCHPLDCPDETCAEGEVCADEECTHRACVGARCPEEMDCYRGFCLEPCDELEPPVAAAGAGLLVEPGEEVALDGSESYTPAGGDLIFSWTQTGGTPVVLEGADSPVASFSAPRPSAILSFELTVTDRCGSMSEPASVSVTVLEMPPVANAGPDQAAGELEMVQLDGTGSLDPNGGSISFAWFQDLQGDAPQVEFMGADTATPAFTAPRVSEPLELSIRLVVTDEAGLTDNDTVTVTIERTIVALSITEQPPAEIEVTQPFSFIVEIRTAGGHVADGANDTISLELLDAGSAALSGALELDAETGRAVFSGLSIDQVESALRIEASSPLLESATSDPFDVVAGPPVRLVVAEDPPDTQPLGSPFSVVAEAQDELGNRATSYDGEAEIAVYFPSNSMSALLGDPVAGAVAGLVIFEGLRIDEVASAFVLVVSDEHRGLEPAFTSVFSVPPFEGGSGTEDDPYRIANIHQLQAMELAERSSFVLVEDIDASETQAWNEGAGFAPIEDFEGTLDGQGHTVSGLHIHRPDTGVIGLLGEVDHGARVENICLKDADILGRNEVGVIAGRTRQDALLSGVCATGSVVAEDRDAGGLVGRNEGEISDSFSKAAVAADDRAGGLAGYHRRGAIDRCYSTGLVEAAIAPGAGGLIGYRPPFNPGSVRSSFWDEEASGVSWSEGGTGKTTAEMKDVLTFTDVEHSEGLDAPWDFDDVWDMDEDELLNEGYPFLRMLAE